SDSVTFNASGYQSGWRSADGNSRLTYTYDGNNRLSTETAIDGALATFTYDVTTKLLDHLAAVNGLTTFTYSSNQLTQIQNPDTGLHTFSYDGSDRLTGELFGALDNSWSYGAGGEVSGYSGEGGQSGAAVSPANVQGLSALAAAPVKGSVTDGD